MKTNTGIIWALLFIYCQYSLVMSTEGGSSRTMRSLQRCLGMPTSKVSSRRNILSHIRSNFAIIPLSYSKPPHGTSTASAVPRRVPRTAFPAGYCPYTTKSEDVPNRMPRFLSYASCREEICNPVICKPVMYSHKVLIKKCDGVWEWSEKTLPVAFVRVV